MLKCPTCDQPMPAIVEVGALRVHSGAHLVSWHGKIISLTDAERSLVKAILTKGSATWQELKEALHPDGDVSTNLLNVVLSRVRRKLKEAKVPYGIQNVRSWGVILVDHDTSLSVRKKPPTHMPAETALHRRH